MATIPLPPELPRSGSTSWFARGAEPGAVVGGVLLLHAAVLAAWHLQPAETRQRVVPQVLELLRAPPPQKVEPPLPPPPPPPPEATRPRPRAVDLPQPAAPPPPALRTAEARPDAPPAAVTIAENTTAPRSSEPVVAAPPAPPPPPPAPPPAEEPLVEPSASAAYLRNPPPRYPEQAQRLGLQGRVVLRVHVLPDGRPDQVELRSSSGRKVLDDAAIEAVRQWTFAPARRGSTAVSAWALVPVDFKLSP